jgi:hypothetical protein
MRYHTISLFIDVFIHHTAYSPQSMSSEVKINYSEQEQQMKLNKGKIKTPG